MVGVGELQIKNQSNELYISTIDDNVTNLESIPENEVYIYRDIYGIPHIYADSNYDMFFGEGYAQAEDHLEGMLKNYLLSIGQMSSVFGENYLMSDHQVRLLKVLSTVQEKYLELSLNSRVTLESFAAGVNFYMSQNPEKTPTWSFTVTPQMVGAVMKLVVLKRPLGRLFKEIQYGTGIKLDSLFESSNKESNEWVVGPEKTKNSYAMLQTDPHLPWFDINSWWEVHLDGPDYHVAGCSLWGFPGVILGHTDKVAWSWTANSPDTADAYLELIRNNNGYEYFYDGQWLDVEVVKETIQVADSNPVEKTFYYTHHGPIVYFDNDYTIAGKMSTWLEVGMIDQILEYNRATSFDDFYSALSKMQLVRWNHVYGDIEGNIFYIWNARVFHRKGNFDYTKPVDGSTSDTEWGDLVMVDELPQEMNPDSKFFQNCNVAPWYVNPNTTITEDDYPNYIVNNPGINGRGMRALNILDASADLSVDDLMNISTDTYSISAEIVVPIVRYAFDHEYENVSDPESLIPIALNLLEDYNLISTVDSMETALTKTVITYYKNTYGGVVSFDPIDPEELDPGTLRNILNIVRDSAEDMLDLYGSLSVRWGGIHVIEKGDNSFEIGNAGGALEPLWMSKGSKNQEGIESCTSGSSFMMLIQLSNPIKAWSTFPISESNDPNSSHYTDVTGLFAQGEYKPSWFTKSDILDNLDPNIENPLILIIPGDNNAPYAPDISGPTSGKTNVEYTYEIFTTDQESDEIFYFINWGDGTVEEWIGPYISGDEITKSHKWVEKGGYTIKAKARDIFGAESEWATLEATMPKNKMSINSPFLRFLEQHPQLFPLLQKLLKL